MTAASITIRERLDEECVPALARGLAAAIADRARVLVIEGAPGQFCLGMNFASVELDAQPERISQFAAVIRALMLAPMPTLAVVDGPAVGGGLGVAAACDFVLASERARFALPEGLYGLAPAIIRPALLARLSPQRLRMLAVTCYSRSAHEALALGLADQVVPVDGLAAARAHTVRQLRRASPDTVAALRRWDADTLTRLVDAGVAETGAALARPEVRAAIEEAVSWG